MRGCSRSSPRGRRPRLPGGHGTAAPPPRPPPVGRFAQGGRRIGGRSASKIGSSTSIAAIMQIRSRTVEICARGGRAVQPSPAPRPGEAPAGRSAIRGLWRARLDGGAAVYCLAAKAIPTRDEPPKMKSIPMIRPRTQKAARGSSQQDDSGHQQVNDSIDE